MAYVSLSKFETLDQVIAFIEAYELDISNEQMRQIFLVLSKELKELKHTISMQRLLDDHKLKMKIAEVLMEFRKEAGLDRMMSEQAEILKANVVKPNPVMYKTYDRVKFVFRGQMMIGTIQKFTGNRAYIKTDRNRSMWMDLNRLEWA